MFVAVESGVECCSSVAGTIVKNPRNADVITETAGAKSAHVEVFVLALDQVSE